MLYSLNTATGLRSCDADSLRLPPFASLRGDKGEAHFTPFDARLVAMVFLLSVMLWQTPVTFGLDVCVSS